MRFALRQGKMIFSQFGRRIHLASESASFL